MRIQTHKHKNIKNWRRKKEISGEIERIRVTMIFESLGSKNNQSDLDMIGLTMVKFETCSTSGTFTC